MQGLEPYEVYAIRFAHHEHRTANLNFIGGDPHEGSMPLDYFVWAITGGGRTFVVDTGFDAATAAARQRDFIQCPSDGLATLGVAAAQVTDVVITHMHFDHAGNLDLFPNARYHIQDREMAYCTGRCMCHPALKHPYTLADVTKMIGHVYDGRVQFHEGAEELAPGLSVHHIGGHTMGIQVVRVWTKRGWVVVASDATHYYANMLDGRPFPVVHNVAEMLEGHKTIQRLASSSDHVIPGHDPLVLKRYPASKPGLEGRVARLDVDPIAPL